MAFSHGTRKGVTYWVDGVVVDRHSTCSCGTHPIKVSSFRYVIFFSRCVCNAVKLNYC